MTSEEHLHFLQFLEERRSMASTRATASAYTIVKHQYMKMHSKNLVVTDIDFRLLKDIKGEDGQVMAKKGRKFKSYAGLVSGVLGKRFDNKDWFEPVNIQYAIKQEDNLDLV